MAFKINVQFTALLRSALKDFVRIIIYSQIVFINATTKIF